MRRFAFLALAVLSTACGARELEVGEGSVSFSTPASADTLLARAAAELTQLGFTIGGREGNLLFTAPRPLPDSARAQPGGTNQLWLVHIVADNKVFSAGSDGIVRAYLVPEALMPSPGNTAMDNALRITDQRPAAFLELRRIAERLNAAANRGY
jgi:hypothetical protein